MLTRTRTRSARRATPRPGLGGRVLRLIAWTLVVFVLTTTAAVTLLRWAAPPGSAFMALETLSNTGERSSVDYAWVDWPKLSPSLALAVIAAEDQRFFAHRGFDIDAIVEAIETFKAGGRLRGASTISQQVAKNLFLWPGRSFLRKGLEAYFTLLIEALWLKRRILEVYLNIAEFGPGIFGVGAASQRFFTKSPDSLSAAEAALLAAVLPNPKRLSVRSPSRYLRSRQNWILRQMRQLGSIGHLERT